MRINVFVPLCAVCIVVGGFVEVARAQQGDEIKAIQQDVAALKSDVKVLVEKQQEMIGQLNDLKKLLQAGDPANAVQPPTTIPINNDVFKGADGAHVAIIEYADFECEFCGQFMREVYPQIVENYISTGKAKFFYRDMTLQSHTHAVPAAIAARCASDQGKFWEMHGSLFADQSALEDKDLSERAKRLGLNTSKFDQCFFSRGHSNEIQASTLAAHKMGINGTPTFLLGVIDPNGNVVSIKRALVGAYSYDVFKSGIDDLLAR